MRTRLLAALVHRCGAGEAGGPERRRLGVPVDVDDVELDRPQLLCGPERAVLVCGRSSTQDPE